MFFCAALLCWVVWVVVGVELAVLGDGGALLVRTRGIAEDDDVTWLLPFSCLETLLSFLFHYLQSISMLLLITQFLNACLLLRHVDWNSCWATVLENWKSGGWEIIISELGFDRAA